MSTMIRRSGPSPSKSFSNSPALNLNTASGRFEDDAHMAPILFAALSSAPTVKSSQVLD